MKALKIQGFRGYFFAREYILSTFIVMIISES